MEWKNSVPRTILLSFSGIDGAGKSTQIQALRASLSGLGLRVGVVPFWDEVASLTGLRENAGHKIFRGEKGVGTPSAPVERRDKNVRSWPMTCFRLFLYLLDAFSVRRVRARLLKSELDVVIFDRFIYDELANLNLRNPLLRLYARVILWLAPAPDLGFLLDADPEQARARKPEYPIEFIYINRQSYKDLSQIVTKIRLVPPMSIDRAHQLISSHTLDALSSMCQGDAKQGAGEDPVSRDRAKSGQAA